MTFGSHDSACCHTVKRIGNGDCVTYGYPWFAHPCQGNGNGTADFVTEGSAEWSFVTERGVKVEMGRRSHRPGFGITYGTYTYGR